MSYKDIENISYKRIIALVDERLNIVELIEEHPCPNGSQWVIYQYERTSPLIISAWRYGNVHHYVLKIGKEKLNLIPSISAAGIEEIYIDDEDNVNIVYAGYAGAGVGIELRKGAENVISCELLSDIGGSKLGRGKLKTPRMIKVVVGIDDTDTKDEGATWVLCEKLGRYIEKLGIGYYLDHTIVQLFPGNPKKTQNCVSVSLSFAVLPKYKYEIKNIIKEFLLKNSLSDKCAFAIYYGITPSKSMKIFTEKAKNEMVSTNEAKLVAVRNSIDIVKVFDKDDGIVGAVAALGLSEHHNEAAKVSEDYLINHYYNEINKD